MSNHQDKLNVKTPEPVDPTEGFDIRAISAPNGEYLAGLAIGKSLHMLPAETTAPLDSTGDAEPETPSTVRHLHMPKIVRALMRAS